jgi:hypothetical protein
MFYKTLKINLMFAFMLLAQVVCKKEQHTW